MSACSLGPLPVSARPLIEQQIDVRTKTQVELNLKPADVVLPPPSVNINLEQPDRSSWVTVTTIDRSDSYDCLFKNVCRQGVQIDTQSVAKRTDIVDFRFRFFCVNPDGTASFRCSQSSLEGVAVRAQCSTLRYWRSGGWVTVNDGFKTAIKFACDG